jgi:processive 1,2-diacylglycerol beta-glucosyltransferase
LHSTSAPALADIRPAMSKVLLLTAGYGEGHNAAARGLQRAFTDVGSDAEIIDLFALTGGAFYEHSRRGYLELINRAPGIWAGFYSLLDRAPIVPMTLPFLGKMQRTLADLLATHQPVAVLSVYPIYGYLIERLYPAGATSVLFSHGSDGLDHDQQRLAPLRQRYLSSAE